MVIVSDKIKSVRDSYIRMVHFIQDLKKNDAAVAMKLINLCHRTRTAGSLSSVSNAPLASWKK
jgi:hypothetical protein